MNNNMYGGGVQQMNDMSGGMGGYGAPHMGQGRNALNKMLIFKFDERLDLLSYINEKYEFFVAI